MGMYPQPAMSTDMRTRLANVYNAGLSDGEKKLIEAAFRSKTLRVLCATSTLATGVNLPADRVLMRGPWEDWEHAGGMSIDK